MQYLELPPPPPLAGTVRRFWFLRGALPTTFFALGDPLTAALAGA